MRLTASDPAGSACQRVHGDKWRATVATKMIFEAIERELLPGLSILSRDCFYFHGRYYNQISISRCSQANRIARTAE